MVDKDFKVYLIEVNTNPSIVIRDNPVKQKIIPEMLDASFKIAVDPLF